MKIRTNFVSNSSSSSFICQVCGETYSNWDASLEEADMFECVNGHTVCNSHIINIYEDNKYDFEGNDAVPEKHCPLCMMESVSDADELLYLHKKFNITYKQVLSEVKEKFKNYLEFKEYIKKDETKN